MTNEELIEFLEKLPLDANIMVIDRDGFEIDAKSENISWYGSEIVIG